MSFASTLRARLVRTPEASRDAVLAALLALVALGLRLYGITDRGFGHPENFVSGVPMPDWVVPPARRVDLDSLYRGTLRDGHPPLYYAFMLAWTKLFGHGLFALRLPSALAGAASVLVVHRLGLRLLRDRAVALLAAALLALHGFHLFWSQLARPYASATFLVLLSTLLLLHLDEGRRRAAAGAYCAATTAALWTQIYAWPVVFVHALWVGWRALRGRFLPAAAAPLLIALVLAMPVVTLALYQNPGNRWNQSPWSFFALGHAQKMGIASWASGARAAVPEWIFVALTILLLGASALGALGTREAPGAALAAGAPERRRWRLAGLAAATLFSAGVIVRFATTVTPLRAASRQLMLATAVLPLLLGLIGGLGLALAARGRRAPAAGARERHALLFALALLPLGFMLAVSQLRGVLVVRGTLVFLPFLLLAVASGVVALTGRVRWLGLAAGAVALLLLTASIPNARRTEGRYDFRGLAEALATRMRPGDLVLVRNDYRASALLYHLPEPLRRQVRGARRSGELRRPHPRHRRIWVVYWHEDPPRRPPWRRPGGFVMTDEVRGRHLASAALYVRRAPSAAEAVR